MKGGERWWKAAKGSVATAFVSESKAEKGLGPFDRKAVANSREAVKIQGRAVKTHRKAENEQFVAD